MKWLVSAHAMKRIAEMDGVDLRDVLRCIADPDVSYSCHAEYGDGAMTAKRGPISVGYKPKAGVITTVLWNTTEQYQRKDEG